MLFFILNLIRLDDDHELAAPTGVIEMTTKATEYPFPKHEKIVLFDLPGIGMLCLKYQRHKSA